MQCGDLRKWDSHCPGDDSTLVRREILKDRAADEVKHERLLQKQRQQLLLRRQSGKGKVQTLLAYTPPGAAEALSQSRSGLFPFTPKWSAVVHGPMCDRYSDKAEKSCARHTTCFDCTGQNRGGGSDGCAGKGIEQGGGPGTDCHWCPHNATTTGAYAATRPLPATADFLDCDTEKDKSSASHASRALSRDASSATEP